ncbi:winged helix-turn-helix domain-containing protein [Streptomyces sp. NPDC091290]|uniref:winged helix-turn-helix domain-containing protein n=1 Tax=Streptomyces sp. NPDC091290 TaxID=3365990 RepID=UPI0037F853EB
MWRLLTGRLGWSLQRPERRAVERDESEIVGWVAHERVAAHRRCSTVASNWCWSGTPVRSLEPGDARLGRRAGLARSGAITRLRSRAETGGTAVVLAQEA